MQAELGGGMICMHVQNEESHHVRQKCFFLKKNNDHISRFESKIMVHAELGGKTCHACAFICVHVVCFYA
jgi:hypothetical protein